MGKRLLDIVFDRHEDFLYEDNRGMKLTPYVMAEMPAGGDVKHL